MGKLIRVIITLVVIVCGCALNPSDGQFTADIDGKTFKPVFTSWDNNPPMNLISAIDITLKVLAITMPDPLEEGTYTLGGVLSEASASYMDLLQQNFYLSESGNLTISSITNERITGTFEMVLVDPNPLGEGTLEVVNGEFDLPSTAEPALYQLL